MVTFQDLEDLGFVRLGDGHGRFPTLRKGRVTLDTGTRVLFFKGPGALVSTKVRAFDTEHDACAGALVLVDLMQGAAE